MHFFYLVAGKEKAMKEKNKEERKTSGADGVLFVEEKLFGGVAAFIYSGLADFLGLVDATYEKPPVEKFPLNEGTFLSGVAKHDKRVRAYLIWGNKDMHPDPISALPDFVHEITHLVDTIITKAMVEDKNGETRAYLTNFYLEKVMEWLGLLDHECSTSKKVEHVVSAIKKELEKTGTSKIK